MLTLGTGTETLKHFLGGSVQNPYLAWKYKLEVSVSGFSTTKDFLANMILEYRPGMRADFRDIRASTRSGTEIPYFIESVTEFNQVFIWFRLPPNTDLFYLHYGNGGVTSKSDGKGVFTFFDHFDKLDNSIWKLIHGSATVSGSILTMQNASLNCILETYKTFAPNTIVEARASHADKNRCIIGFRNTSTQKTVAWQGSTQAVNNDHRFTHNGSSGTWRDDGVNRAGAYYVYAAANLISQARFFVNYSERTYLAETLPGNVSLPVSFYSEVNKGALRVDWVRVRDFTETMPVLTTGRKYTTQPKGYPWDNAITEANTRIGMYPSVNIKSFLKNINTPLGMKANVMFRRPLFYNPQLKSPYPNWKYKGEIYLGDQGSPARIRLNILPGMTVDGRDLRLTDKDGQDLRFNIFDYGPDYLDIWVEIPAGTNNIDFYYGNGTAKTHSNPEINGVPDTETIIDIIPNLVGGNDVWQLPGWEYQQEIKLSETASGSEQVLLSIPYHPGMTADGRDFRFFDLIGNKLSYYIETITSTEFSVWVKLPKDHDKILFFFGNGLAASESSASDVFDIWDDFEGSTLGPEWTLAGGVASVTNSTMILGSTVRNSLIRGSTVFGPGHIVEMRMYHPNQNQTICGFWSATNQRACWLGASGTNYNDHTHTHNGSTSTNTDDGINRGGTTFHKYGITYELGSIGFFVDDNYRRTMTVTTPSGSIPISFYSTANKGDLVIDWVRVRKITNISGILGKLKRKPGVLYYETITEKVIEIIPETHVSHNPQWKTPQIYYEYIKAPTSYMGMQPGEPTFKERRELRDYAIVSSEVTKSINDAYIQLSTEFQNLTVPPEGSTIKHNAYDSQGNPHLIFHGKILTNSPTYGHYSQTVKMNAVDNSINLVTQPIPWNYHIIDTEIDSIQTWINRLLEPEKTGVYPNTIIDVNVEPRQFIFDPKAKRLEAIRKLAEYARCMYHTKLITREIDGHIITRPEFYFVPPERIDEPVNGFDLPTPLILDVNASKLISDPHVMNESEEKYNSVLVYGVLSENGESVVGQAFSYEVYTGEQKPKVYIIEDNAITEKGSTAEREAIKWLLYFLSKRVKVTMSFVDRFDFELYQRIRFGPEFSDKLRGLTQSQQVKFVAANDPRDAENSTHLVDVSGVPRPRWLRISDIKHISEHKLEIVNITAITDNIYSVIDPIVPAPWSDFLSPGYYKPIIDDLVDTTQSIVEDRLEKQLTPESCTVLSINEENKTAVVQTASGKIVTVSLA